MTIGCVNRPCWPSHQSSCASSSETECAAKNSGPMRRRVASSATAFAPFSQNSAMCRLSSSGQAQPGQSNPSLWFTRSRLWTLRLTPIWSYEICSACSTAGTPTATFLGWVERTRLSSMSVCGGFVAIPLG